MLKNFLLTAWRNLVRNKAFTFINIFGLSLGLACSLLIFLWVQDERTVDTGLIKDANTYGVYERVFSEGNVEAAHWTPGLLATELKRKVPEIKYASGFWPAQEILFSAGEKNIMVKGCFADSDYFKMFNYHFLQGQPASALSEPGNIALSRKMAVEFFGSPEAAFGRSIRYNKLAEFRVAAVFEDAPANASMQFDYAINWQYLIHTMDWLTNWINRSPTTFIQLLPHTDPAKVAAAIKGFVNPYLNRGYGAGFNTELGLQRFDQMYLYSTFKNGVPVGGRIENVRLFSMVAVFVLLLACTNFMNLATARSAKRAKEVGIRKTIGAGRYQLILQFIGEFMLLALLAFIAALVIVWLLLPLFNQVTGKSIVLPIANAVFWLEASGLLLVTGLVAGSYPALFLSSLVPLKVLKGAFKFSPSALFCQERAGGFPICIVHRFYSRNHSREGPGALCSGKEPGFDRENLVYVPMERGLARQFNLLKERLSAVSGVVSMSYSNQLPTEFGAHVYDLSWDGKDPAAKVVAIHNGVGYDYLRTMHLSLLMGRDFSRDFPTDTVGYVINESTWKMTGYKDPIGRSLIYFGHRGKIIGVVKDFNFKSLHDPIQPLVLEFMGEQPNWDGTFAIVKVAAGKTKGVIAAIEQACKSLDPAYPFRYSFADEEYQKLYTSERTVSKLSDSCSLLAIVISCLGLLGLSMFTAEQRRKEIGVRKVIGASVKDIVVMLSSDVIRLVLLASIIATPLAWFAMNQWLGNFAYRITIDWRVFLSASAGALVIALVTISYQAIKGRRCQSAEQFKGGRVTRTTN